jgi:hypothetical protein
MNETKPILPAFPTEHRLFFRARSGMSVREYFVAKAMQGLMANPEFFKYLQDDETYRQRLLLPALSWVDSFLAAAEES